MEHQDITLPADVLRQVPSLLLRGVLVALIERADSNGVVTIKVNSVCEEWEISRQQLRTALNKLVATNFLANLPTNKGRKGGTTLKVLNIQRYVKIYYYGKVASNQYGNQYQEKERKQEKERFPHTPSKEKEINKEKEVNPPPPAYAREEIFPKQPSDPNLHPNTTPSKDAVFSYIINGEAAMRYPGDKRQMAERFFNKFNAVGWIDALGRKITNWKSRADLWVLDEIARNKSNTPRNETYQTDRLARRRGTETSAQSAEDYEDTL